jgi:hypothetical protein
MSSPGRSFPAVMEYRDDRWLLMHTHFSVRSRPGRGPILLSSAPDLRPIRSTPTWGRAGTAGDVHRTDNHGHQRTTNPKVGRAARW